MTRRGITFGLCLLLVFGGEMRVGAKTDVWKRLGLSGERVTALATAPANPGTIYAGTASGALFKIVGGLQTQLVQDLGARSNPVTAIAVDPRDSNTVYAATADGLFKSTNAGINWMMINSDVAGSLALAIDPQNSMVVYAAADALGLFKTTDAGVMWIRTSLGPSVQSFVIDPQNSAIVYAGTSLGVVKSTDGGISWLNYSSPREVVRGMAIDPKTPATLYAGVAGSVFKSTDAGVSWKDSGLNSLPVYALVVDTQETSTLYAATEMGPFKSIDAGRSWFLINEGLTTKSSTIDGDLALCKVYAGTADGVFETDIGPVLTLHSNLCVGDTWKVVVSHAPGNSPIRLLGVSNGTSWEVSIWGATNGAGMFTELGNFPAYTEGNHQLRVDVGGVPSNTVSFTVTNCRR